MPFTAQQHDLSHAIQKRKVANWIVVMLHMQFYEIKNSVILNFANMAKISYNSKVFL